MDGAEVRSQREKLGLKRPQLAERTGLTIAQIAGIETGRVMRDDEETRIRQALQLEVTSRVDERGNLRRAPRDVADPLRWTGSHPVVSMQLDDVKVAVQTRRMSMGKQTVDTHGDTKFERVFTWQDLTQGDPVRVRATTFDEPGLDNYVRGSYVFNAHVTNVETGHSWIEVIGGKSGHRLMRDYVEERVEPVVRRRRRGKGASS